MLASLDDTKKKVNFFTQVLPKVFSIEECELITEVFKLYVWMMYFYILNIFCFI